MHRQVQRRSAQRTAICIETKPAKETRILKNVLEMIRAKRPGTSAELKAARAQLSAEHAERRLRDLQEKRQRILLEASDKEVVALEAEITAARLDAERVTIAT